MEQIQYFYLPRLRNNEHFQFMTDMRNKVEEVTPEVLSLDTIFPRFKAAHDELNVTLLVDRGSVKTEHLTELDTLRDSTWSALGSRIRASLNSPFTEEADSAKILNRVFDLYGNIRHMSYNEETAALSNLIEDLEQSENETHCEVLGITQWVVALKRQNNDFQTMLDARNIELAGKSSGDVRGARTVIDPVYKEITDRLNAMVTLDMATPEMQGFIRELNQRIKYYEDTLAARTGRNSSEEEEEEINPPVAPL